MECKKYSENKEYPTLYGRCSIYGYCMIKAGIINECKYKDKPSEIKKK